MTHSPIQIRQLTLAFPHKTCFSDVSVNIHAGSRIGIMGPNGAGKTTFLRIVQGLDEPNTGSVHMSGDVRIGYVAQIIDGFHHCSGGQRFQMALTQALLENPNVLLLDEPTNHLDARNKASLLRMLDAFDGTLIVISHDIEVLERMDTLWIIDQGQLQVFQGSYSAYRHEVKTRRAAIQQEIGRLDRQKKQTHQSLMKEQERSKKSNVRGEKSASQKKWPGMIAGVKSSQAGATSGAKRKALRDERFEAVEKLASLRLPEIIVPTFTLQAPEVGDRTLVCVSEGSAGYVGNVVLSDVYVSLGSRDRVALVGDNGSGKSTLVKALMGDFEIVREGQWEAPLSVGYWDQHYSTLNQEKTVLEMLMSVMPDWTHAVARQHLNSFLFRKNEEVSAKVAVLSGGERARLSLAVIAASTPRLLILDEVTNNVDLATREHIIQVLQGFPGALIVISHDKDFLNCIGASTQWHVKGGSVEVL